MRIAFLFGSMSRGGAERMISHLANRWVKNGNCISIITLDNSSSKYKLDDDIKIKNLNVAGISSNLFDAISRNIHEILSIRNVIQKEKYDVIIAFNMRLAVYTLIAKGLIKGPKIVASERANPRFDTSNKTIKKIWNICYRFIDGFIFQTEGVKKYYPLNNIKKSIVIPNGVFKDMLPKTNKSINERDPKKIVAVGRLNEQKDYTTIIKAFCESKAFRNGFVLNIYGEGPLYNSLSVLTKQLGADKQIIFHGNVENIVCHINDARLFLMGSIYEGMPNALMEAMACGIPCISTNCEFGPGEIIQDHKNGVLVAVGDVTGMAKAIDEVLNNDILSKYLSENAFRIREEYSGDVIADKYLDFIKAL